MFTGSYAINPVNGEPIPIWIADYVLISYGTGAIMAVPAHDERDFEFAREVRPADHAGGHADQAWLRDISKARSDQRPSEASVLEGRDGKRFLALRQSFTGDGRAVNSGEYNALPTAEFKQRIAADLAGKGLGRAAVNYKLRDWLFSRQHFWGEPFPILRELDEHGQPNGRLRALRPEDLPLDLPDTMKFDAAHDRPEPPLDKAPDSWLYVTLDGKRYKRETNTMPQWAGSCWYYLRFLDPANDQALVDPELEKAWMPVDLYVGGAEHAVLHLLYARFWHKVLYDRGYVSMTEPFQKLVNQGMILGETEYTGYRNGDWRMGQRQRGGRRRRGQADRQDHPRAVDGRESQARGCGQARRGFRVEGRSVDPHRQPGLQNVEEPAAMSSIPMRLSRSMGPTRYGCTRCSWARWKRSNPGARRASAASPVFSIASGG